MTPAERFKDIELRAKAFKHWHTVNPENQLVHYGETYGPDIEWLIERVKTLESALEEIATCKTVGHSEARKHRRVAQKALEGKE